MEVMVDEKDLIIKRLELSKFSTNAYLIICPRTNKSALIDVPAGARTILKYLKGTQLEGILLTHNHSDHIGGLRAVRNKIQAPLAVHPADSSEWLPIRPDIELLDRKIIQVGQIRIKCLFTPGHTPGSMCFKIGKYLLAGDTLFPGGPGRTTSPGEFRQIVKSITGQLFKLPDDTCVFPGHGGPALLAKEKAQYDLFSSRTHNPNLCGDVTWLNS